MVFYIKCHTHPTCMIRTVRCNQFPIPKINILLDCNDCADKHVYFLRITETGRFTHHMIELTQTQKKNTFFYRKKLSVSLERKRISKTVVFIYGIVGGSDIGERVQPKSTQFRGKWFKSFRQADDSSTFKIAELIHLNHQFVDLFWKYLFGVAMIIVVFFCQKNSYFIYF